MMKEPRSRVLGPASQDRACQICHQRLPAGQLVLGSLVRHSISALIRQEYPEWSEAGYICTNDLHRFRMRHVQEVVAAEVGELSELETRVLESMDRHTVLAADVLGEFREKLSFGDRLSDQIAGFGGSWTFISSFFLILVVWMAINTFVLVSRPFDPYPFILLNLVLSCLAAIQAPIIMMSQNRQEAKDRVRGEHDYQVNLKAELEIRQLHDKLDHMLIQQWQRMVEIQQIQTELIDELVDWHRGRTSADDR